MQNDICKDLISRQDVEYEQPWLKIVEAICGKVKLILLITMKSLIIDLKTTADIHKFNGQHLNIITIHSLYLQ